MKTLKIVIAPLHMYQRGYIGNYITKTIHSEVYSENTNISKLVSKYKNIYGKTHYVTYNLH